MPRPKKLPKHVRRHRDRYRAVFSVEGRRITSPSFETPEEAAQYARLYKDVPEKAHSVSLRDGFENLLAHLKSTGARQGTIDHYEKYWKVITRPAGWGADTPLHRVNRDQVKRYAAKRIDAGASLATVWTKEIQLLERILNQAYDDELLPNRPLEKLKKPKIRHKRFDYMSRNTIANLIQAIRNWSAPDGRGPKSNERDADLLAFAFSTGMRRGEISRCRPDDLDFEGRTIFVEGKNDNRHLPMTDEVERICRRAVLRAGTEPLFGGPRQIEKVFERWRKRLEEPRLAPHVLRHSFATEMVRQGVHMLDLMALLGHKTPTQTARYFHANTAHLQSVMSKMTTEPKSEHRDSSSAGS